MARSVSTGINPRSSSCAIARSKAPTPGRINFSADASTVGSPETTQDVPALRAMLAIEARLPTP
jgi:hypothetical protein